MRYYYETIILYIKGDLDEKSFNNITNEYML